MKFFPLILIMFGFISQHSLQSQNAATPKSPCLTNDAYRQFDFWIGEWDVYQNGTLAGKSKIEIILDSCIISENWYSASSGYKGKSYNYYDPVTGSWHQTWVDNFGGGLEFQGKKDKEKLEFKGVSVDKEGEKTYYRMTYFLRKDKNVRQLWEQSTDQEKWTNLFDGLYIPKGSELPEN